MPAIVVYEYFVWAYIKMRYGNLFNDIYSVLLCIWVPWAITGSKLKSYERNSQIITGPSKNVFWSLLLSYAVGTRNPWYTISRKQEKPTFVWPVYQPPWPDAPPDDSVTSWYIAAMPKAQIHRKRNTTFEETNQWFTVSLFLWFDIITIFRMHYMKMLSNPKLFSHELCHVLKCGLFFEVREFLPVLYMLVI